MGHLGYQMTTTRCVLQIRLATWRRTTFDIILSRQYNINVRPYASAILTQQQFKVAVYGTRTGRGRDTASFICREF